MLNAANRRAGEGYRAWLLRRRKAIAGDMLDSQLPSKGPVWSMEAGGLVLKCYRGSLRRDQDLHPEYRCRDVAFRIGNGASTVSVAEFVEWNHDDGWFEASCWLDLLDSISQAEYDFAEIVNHAWDEYDHPMDYGNLVRFDRLLIDTKEDKGRNVWAVLNEAIRREFGRRATALVLKAFPLEFEGVEGESDKWLNRRKAMIEHYRLRLEAASLPGYAGEHGWMWRAISGYCPDPVENPRDDWFS